MGFLLAYEGEEAMYSSVVTMSNLEMGLTVLGTTSPKQPIAVRKTAREPNKTSPP